LKRGLILILLVSAGFAGCVDSRSDRSAQTGAPPLADTLVAIFHQLKTAALANRPEEMMALLDSTESSRLASARRTYGQSALTRYLESRFGGWPDPDTLWLEDLTLWPPYARLALAGPGSRFGYRKERVRYTFLLFRQVAGDWRLAAGSCLEKERYDPYGARVGYLETELPPRLRFPRLL